MGSDIEDAPQDIQLLDGNFQFCRIGNSGLLPFYLSGEKKR
jgi:hypothetical protein